MGERAAEDIFSGCSRDAKLVLRAFGRASILAINPGRADPVASNHRFSRFGGTLKGKPSASALGFPQ
jgi:hypothetical protein